MSFFQRLCPAAFPPISLPGDTFSVNTSRDVCQKLLAAPCKNSFQKYSYYPQYQPIGSRYKLHRSWLSKNMCMVNRTELCREWKRNGLKSTEPEASLQKVLPIIRGMKTVFLS